MMNGNDPIWVLMRFIPWNGYDDPLLVTTEEWQVQEYIRTSAWRFDNNLHIYQWRNGVLEGRYRLKENADHTTFTFGHLVRM